MSGRRQAKWARTELAKLPPGVAACYAITAFGLQILLSRRLDPRRRRAAMRSIELMIAQRWRMAVITDEDLSVATDRADRALLKAEDRG